MKNILVPIDFSEVSKSAANYAAGLARYTSAKLILYYVFAVPIPMADTPLILIEPEEFERQNMKLLHALDRKLKTKYGKIETELWSEPGFVVDAISRFTKNHKIDLVIMGVTGAGKNPGLLGSNTTSIMHRIANPVLVIPKGYEFKKPSTIALACDYKSILPEETINTFKTFVRLFDSEVLVFNVLKKDELASYQKSATEVNFENTLGDMEHSLYFPSGDDMPKEINKFIDKHKVEMLVMFPHHYNL